MTKFYVIPVADEMAPRIEEGVVCAAVRFVKREDGLHEAQFTSLKVPAAIALGLYEKLTDEELTDHAADLAAEQERRAEAV